MPRLLLGEERFLLLLAMIPVTLVVPACKCGNLHSGVLEKRVNFLCTVGARARSEIALAVRQCKGLEVFLRWRKHDMVCYC